jgi:hypothetical protein
MSRHLTTWTLVVTVLIAVGAGCGGDDAEKPASNEKGGASGRAAETPKGLGCGTNTCMPPEPAGDLEACCLDPFSSTCGLKKPGGLCATAATNGDPRCPSVDVMAGLVLPSCCTDDGKCGINAAMFGAMGCVELGTAAEMAKTMGGASLMFPAPRACAQ